VRKAAWGATVSVILPVYNGERWMAAKLESILALHYPAELVEILVVSDGSTTHGQHRWQLRRPRENRIPCRAQERKGGRFERRHGKSSGEILFFTDVRQQLHPGQPDNLVACFADPSRRGQWRTGDPRRPRHRRGQRRLYWKYEKWIRKQQSRLDSVMGATGCIYAMRRHLASALPEDTLNDDMFLPLGAFFRGFSRDSGRRGAGL